MLLKSFQNRSGSLDWRGKVMMNDVRGASQDGLNKLSSPAAKAVCQIQAIFCVCLTEVSVIPNLSVDLAPSAVFAKDCFIQVMIFTGQNREEQNSEKYPLNNTEYSLRNMTSERGKVLLVVLLLLFLITMQKMYCSN